MIKYIMIKYIIFLLILSLIICYCNKKSFTANINKTNDIKNMTNYIKYFINNYAYMIHLNNHKESQDRIIKTLDKWNYLTIPKISNALHYKHDKNIIDTMPIKMLDNIRRGAYGLAGTTYRNLKEMQNKNVEYYLHLEDDCIPIQNLTNNEFIEYFYNSLKTIPDDSGIYNFSLTVYCNKYFKNKKSSHKWIKYNKIKKYTAGFGVILFTKKAINNILNLIENKVKLYAVDEYIKHNYDNYWYYDGLINSNGMFYGLFEQLGTSCSNRYLNTMD